MRTSLFEYQEKFYPHLCILLERFPRIYQTVLRFRCTEFQQFLYYIYYSYSSFLRCQRLFILLTHASAVLCAPLRHTQHITTLFTSPDKYSSTSHSSHNRSVMLFFVLLVNDYKLCCTVLWFIIFINDFTQVS